MHENRLDVQWHRLVLQKLKRYMVNGVFITGEVLYQYEWDDKKGLQWNLKQVRMEDAALLYFEQSGVINSRREENHFKAQKRAFEGGYMPRPDARYQTVWMELWEEADSALREYDQTVFLYSIDMDKFEQALHKFKLQDSGLELVDLSMVAKQSPVSLRYGKFSLHKDKTMSYDNHPINVLRPQTERLLHDLIKAKGRKLAYEQIVDVMWSESAKYLDKESLSVSEIRKRINSAVSEINKALFPLENRKLIEAVGKTGYKLISDKTSNST